LPKAVQYGESPIYKKSLESHIGAHKGAVPQSSGTVVDNTLQKNMTNSLSTDLEGVNPP